MENNEEKDEIFSLLGGVIKGKYELQLGRGTDFSPHTRG